MIRQALLPVVEAEPEEVFEVYDEEMNLVGTESRRTVHALGLLHKAVYCFVFNLQGELLVQKRSLHKRVAPGLWDLSVAEHLQPGESFLQGAERGLKEELGIVTTVRRAPLTSVHVRRMVIPEIKVNDFEFVESYYVENWSGSVVFNPEEVSEVKYVELNDLKYDMHNNPSIYTEWFKAEVELVNWFGKVGELAQLN